MGYDTIKNNLPKKGTKKSKDVQGDTRIYESECGVGQKRKEEQNTNVSDEVCNKQHKKSIKVGRR